MRDLAILRTSGPPSTWRNSSAAALCVASAVSASLGHVQWEAGFGEAALAVAAVTIAVLLVAMVRLAILDWRAEKQSRRAWTAIARIAELATPPPLEALERSCGDPYAPAPHNPALWRILRAHRHVVPVSLAKPIPSIPSADAGAEPPRSAPQSADRVPCGIASGIAPGRQRRRRCRFSASRRRGARRNPKGGGT
jgi:hypothetical protein